MSEKKEQNKFTIQFSPADPAHRQVIDILNQQGRRKAQFLVSAVQHYLHCPETPDIPQPVPVDTRVIEDIVRRIIEGRSEPFPAERKQDTAQPQSTVPKTENLDCDEYSQLLGTDGMNAISQTLAMFRKG